MVGPKHLWIVANWKSNKTIAQALEWVETVGPQIPKTVNLKVVVCPAFSCLSEVKKAVMVGNFPIIVGAQNLSPFDVGAFTGEEPASLLKELVSFSIIGHSERRQNFGETDEMIDAKVKQALASNITPLVCVQSAGTPVPPDCKLVAYEPVWAIGTGNPDTPENANQVALKIKQANSQVEVIYGGSVTADNVKGFNSQEHISGVLPGKASLNPQDFINIINACKE